jgi:hypothetical protein
MIGDRARPAAGFATRVAIAVLVAATLWLTACIASGAGSESGSRGSSFASGDRPSSTAKLSIVSPANGSVIRGTTVRVRLRLEGASVVKPTTSDLRPDEGHIHILLDGSLVSMNYSLADEIRDVAPGRHLLQAEFVASDHAPFDPRVVVVSSFEVRR